MVGFFLLLGAGGYIIMIYLTLKVAFSICCFGREEMGSFSLQEGRRAGRSQDVMWGSVVLIHATWSSAGTGAPVWTLDPLCSKISEQAPVWVNDWQTLLIFSLWPSPPAVSACLDGKVLFALRKCHSVMLNTSRRPPALAAPPVCRFLTDTHASVP